MNNTCQSCIRHSPMDKCCTLDGSTKGKTHKACSQWQHRPGHKEVLTAYENPPKSKEIG